MLGHIPHLAGLEWTDEVPRYVRWKVGIDSSFESLLSVLTEEPLTLSIYRHDVTVRSKFGHDDQFDVGNISP
jgi:hypothetical protein